MRWEREANRIHHAWGPFFGPFVMADLCDGGPLRWRPFAMADRNPCETGSTNISKSI